MANPVIEVVSMTTQHLRMIKPLLRDSEMATFKQFRVRPYKTLWRAYKRSVIARTAFINGEIVAVWGCTGVHLGSVGCPWSHICIKAEEFPMRLAFRYRQEIKEMLQIFPVLIDMVDATHEKSLKMLKILGFKFSEPMPFGASGILYIQAKKEL